MYSSKKNEPSAADKKSKWIEYQKAVCLVVEKKDVSGLRDLLRCENSRDILSISEDGATILHKAAAKGASFEIMDLLLSHDCYEIVNKKEKRNKASVLHFAVENCSIEVVQLLIDVGANVEAETKDLKTPLYWAAGAGRKDILEALVKNGARVDRTSSEKQTALFEAVGQGNKESVLYLLEQGVDVNACDKQGETVLHESIRRDDRAITDLLLKHKADKTIKNLDGRTPYNVFKTYGSQRQVRRNYSQHDPYRPR